MKPRTRTSTRHHDRMTTPLEGPPSDVPEEIEVERRRKRAMRRLLRGFRSADSYGLVLLMIVATYAIAINVDGRWASLMILVQIITVRLSLHTSLRELAAAVASPTGSS